MTVRRTRARSMDRWPLMALVAAAAACSGSSPTTQMTTVCSAATAQAISLSPGAYIPLDPGSNAGCMAVPANKSVDTAEYLLVALAGASAPNDSSTFNLTSAGSPAAAPALAMRAPATRRFRPARSIAAEFDARLRAMAHSGSYPRSVPRAGARVTLASSVPAVGSTHNLDTAVSFIVCDTVTCATTQMVVGRRMFVGAHVAIYQDENAPAGGLDSAQYDSLGRVFDQRLYPLDTLNFGAPSDVDSNHVVIALFTNQVNGLVDQQECDTLGFVIGYFFGGDLDPAVSSFYNRAEIYYSLVADTGGYLSCAHSVASVERLSLRSFVHELQHMINFGQHVLKYHSRITEEGWLDEGLSTYAEELAARNFLPDTTTFRQMLRFGDLFDAYEYLTAPDSSYLEIPLDQGTIPEVGASWLFVRYLMDQNGPGLAAQLVQTPLYGANNVATHAGAPFPTIVSQWALANYVSDLPGLSVASQLKYTSWHFRTAYDTLHAGDTLDFPLNFPLVPHVGMGSTFTVGGVLRAGTGYFRRLLQPPGDPGTILSFTSGSGQAFPAGLGARLAVIRIR